MARNFDGSSEYLSRTDAIVTAAPFTMSVWFRRTDTLGGEPLFGLGASADNDNRWTLIANVSTNTLDFFCEAGGANSNCTGSNTYTVNEWSHACGIAAAVDDRTSVLDGDWASRGTSTLSRTPSGINRTSLAVNLQSTAINPYPGDLAEAAIWDVALTQSEVETLAAGFSPLFVRPASLVAYWPLLGGISPEPDRVGGNGLTLTGTPTSAAHVPLIYPASPYVILPAAVVGGGFNAAWARGSNVILGAGAM